MLGAHTISQPSGREIFRFVSRIERHPMFDPVTFDFDVLLLEVSALKRRLSYLKNLIANELAPPVV